MPSLRSINKWELDYAKINKLRIKNKESNELNEKN